MTKLLVAAALKVAEAVAQDLVKAGARRLGREILGTPVERGMRGVYKRAIAGLLIEVGETVEAVDGSPDPEVMKVAESVLGGLCCDDEAAGLLLNVALTPGLVPVKALRERAITLGYDPDTLPFAFDSAMWMLADRVWEEFLAEAREDSSLIQPLILKSEDCSTAIRSTYYVFEDGEWMHRFA